MGDRKKALPMTGRKGEKTAARAHRLHTARTAIWALGLMRILREYMGSRRARVICLAPAAFCALAACARARSFLKLTSRARRERFLRARAAAENPGKWRKLLIETGASLIQELLRESRG